MLEVSHLHKFRQLLKNYRIGTGCYQSSRDNPYDLLRIVSSMSDTESGRRDQLQTTENFIHFPRARTFTDVYSQNRNDERQQHTNQRRKKNEVQYRCNFVHFKDFEIATGMCNGCSRKTTNKGM